MFEQITAIAKSIAESFLHTWPYLLVTIPVAVAVRLSGAAKYIGRAFRARPLMAILLATAVGAFSPFCSCGVVPVVAALLISGVPLAPVMSFWIASPSMDPEIFFLSVATIGWELAVWRLASTLVLSLGSGLMTHFMERRGWLGQSFLRSQRVSPAWSIRSALQTTWARLWQGGTSPTTRGLLTANRPLQPALACCSAGVSGLTSQMPAPPDLPEQAAGCVVRRNGDPSAGLAGSDSNVCGSSAHCGCEESPDALWRRLLKEAWDATAMVVKFMLLAFFLSALIKLYVPSELVAELLGQTNPWAIPTAALLGVPTYASNLTALPMIGGLLTQGMSQSAALAFLISGPTTTLPAMAAVWGLSTRRVFALYVAYSLVGAIVLAFCHNLVSVMF